MQVTSTKTNSKQRLNEIFLRIGIFLTFLVPPAIISGPFLSDLFISLIALIFLIRSIINLNFKWIRNDIILILLFFNLYIIFGSLISNYVLLSLESSLFYFRFLIFAAAIAWWIIPNLKKYKLFFYSILLSYSFVLFDGFVQYIYGKDIFGYPLQTYHVSGPFGDELVLGKYLAVWSATITGILLTKKIFKKEKLFLSGLVFILADVLVFLSGQRVAFFMLIFSTVLILLIYKKYKFLRITTLVVSFVTTFLILFFNENVQKQMIDKTVKQLSLNNDKYIFQDDFYGAIYLTSFNIFRDNIIFGIGVKNYREECKNEKYDELNATEIYYRCSTHPHSIYLQLLSETGLVGSFIFSIFIFLLLKRLYLYIFIFKRSPEIYFLFPLIGLFTTLWPLMPSGNFFNNWFSVSFYFLLGLVLNSEKSYFIKDGKKNEL